jgi:hypothetical protein
MKKIIISSCLALFLILLLALPVVATSSWKFMFPIYVTDTGNTTRTNLAVDVSGASNNLNGLSLNGAGYILSSGLDTNMQFGTNNVGYMISTTRAFALVSSLPALGQLETDLYTGYTTDGVNPQTSIPIMVGNTGYITDNDLAALEFGNNFAAEFNGYIDTSSGASKYLLYKDSAYELSVNGGYITSDIMNQSTLGADGNGVALCYLNNTTFRGGSRFNSFSGTIDSAKVYLSKASSPTGTLTMTVRAVSDDSLIGTLGTLDVSTLTGSMVEKTFSSPVAVSVSQDIRVLAEYTNGSAVNYVAVGNTASAGKIASTYTTSYTDSNNVGAILISIGKSVTNALASGTHTVKAYADGTNLKLDIDGSNVQSTTLSGATVANNANNWIINQNNAIPSMTYYKHTVSGVEKSWFQPTTMIVGTAVVDRDSTQNATITFGTNSNITISYGSISSYQQTSVSSSSGSIGWHMGSISIPTNWFTSGTDFTQLPLYGLFNSTASQTGIPVQTFYIITNLFFALFFFLIMVVGTRSIFMGILAVVLMMFIGVVQTIYPAWILFAAIFLGGGILFVWRQQ